ncbi:MAG: hypothetical protein CL489_10470 [Acidobacteria bacterium]|nr:hypothetical protein [Acidobacteriota bacterium]
MFYDDEYYAMENELYHTNRELDDLKQKLRALDNLSRMYILDDDMGDEFYMLNRDIIEIEREIDVLESLKDYLSDELYFFDEGYRYAF